MTSPDLQNERLPADPDDCEVFVEATIGPRDGPGEEIFGFTVVTPKRLLNAESPRWGRGLLIIPAFSWPAVRESVEKLLSHYARETWDRVAADLNKELAWEFDNYKQ